jgi:hypothetical protein
MALAAAAAAMVFSVGAGYGGEVTDGTLIYQSGHRGRSVIERLELDSGLRSRLYTSPNRRTIVTRMRAGGGRVVFEASSRGVRILAMDAGGVPVEEVAEGREDRPGICGSTTRLLDVSSSGEALYERATVGCRTRRGRWRLHAQAADGTVRTLLSRRARDVYLGDLQPPYRQLAGNQLVTSGDGLVRVRDLDTGLVRRFVPRDRLSTFSDPAVAADGRVLLSEFRFMGRNKPPLQTIRLVKPGGESTVIHRRQRVYGEPRFCGDRATFHTFSQRGRLRLSLLDPPALVFEGVLDPDVTASCDAGHYVFLTISGATSERAYVHELPQ